MALNSLAGVSFKGETNEVISLNSKLIPYLRLLQLQTFFNKVKEDGEVKARVLQWITVSDMMMGGSAVCLVVGVMICEDVDVEWGATTRKDAVGQIESLSIKSVRRLVSRIRWVAPAIHRLQDP